jgi:hypothetical protein
MNNIVPWEALLWYSKIIYIENSTIISSITRLPSFPLEGHRFPVEFFPEEE